MSLNKGWRVGGLALLMGSVLLAAKPDAGDKPKPGAAHAGHGRLTKPWNEIKDLTEDEKTKILAIHQKALDDIKAIDAKETEDIMGLLTDSQKKEVEEIEAKDKEAMHTHKPTTQPAK